MGLNPFLRSFLYSFIDFRIATDLPLNVIITSSPFLIFSSIENKATYFIESVLIGTEVPPLIFYESSGGFEVIDGRQRFETLLRYQGNQFPLSPKGLAVRKDIAHKRFDDLSPEDKNFFFDAKLRQIRFSVVNPDSVDEHAQDMLKKEIFRRYNSGITPLRGVDIEKAVYITDEPTKYLKHKFQKNEYLYGPFLNLFLGISDINTPDVMYADKDIIDFIKQVTGKHSSWFYITRDNKRMRNEELITILTYLSYTQLTKSSAQAPIDNIVDVFRTPLGIGVRIKQKAAVTLMMDMATISSDMKEKEEIAEAVKKTEAFIRKVRTILINKDAEDDTFLDKQLTSLFNVAGRHWYVRRNHDFYALWYLLYDITPEVAIRRRDEIRKDLNELLRSMKKESKEAETEIAPFMSAVSAFKAKYAVAERKIRLTREQKEDLIKKQNNICPLCGASIYIMDDVDGDHTIPIGIQGPDEYGNLQIVHAVCNKKKGVKSE